MKMIDYLRFSRFLIDYDAEKILKDEFDNYIREGLASQILPEIERVIKVEELNNHDPYNRLFEASVVIIPTDEAAEINRKLKRLEELERQHVTNND